MTASKEEIKRALEDAIRNCNRNMYEWITKNKRGSRFVITYTEVKGVVKNWIVRRLRTMIDHADLDRAIRYGNLVISINEKDGYIERIYLNDSNSHWSGIDNIIKRLMEAMESINYKHLKYDPSDYEIDGVQPKEAHFGNPANISLDTIKNIKF